MSISRVLMVCTGNICRSPLAEYWLAREMPALTVSSAGVGALVGHPADDHAIAVGEANGLDLAAHRARQIDMTLVHDNDLILVMEQGQARWINQNFPQSRGRVFLLGHWTDKEPVPDPYRQSREQFEAIYEVIERQLKGWIKPLGGLASAASTNIKQ